MIINHLSKLLGEKRINQSEFSKKTGIGKNVINMMYNDFAERVSLDNIDRMCEVLNCSVGDIFEYVPNKIKKTGNDVIADRRKSPSKQRKTEVK